MVESSIAFSFFFPSDIRYGKKNGSAKFGQDTVANCGLPTAYFTEEEEGVKRITRTVEYGM